MKKYIKLIAEVVKIEVEELICALITGGTSVDDFEAEINSRIEQEFFEMEKVIKL